MKKVIIYIVSAVIIFSVGVGLGYKLGEVNYFNNLKKETMGTIFKNSDFLREKFQDEKQPDEENMVNKIKKLKEMKVTRSMREKEKFKNLKIKCSDNLKEACFMAGEMISKSNILRTLNENPADFFKKACDLGMPVACSKHSAYFSGNKKSPKALKNFRDACNVNDANSCILLYRHTRDGADKKLVYNVLKNICEKDAKSCHHVGSICYREGRLQEAYDFYKKSCSDKDPGSQGCRRSAELERKLNRK